MNDITIIEAFIFQRIKLLEDRLEQIEKLNRTHPCKTYLDLYCMTMASINQLYIILTAYSNPLENEALFTEEK